VAVTLRDVAARAGVSTRTVSNVVNDFRHVAPDTRARVQAALVELDYRPNLLARSLRQGRTGIVTLLVPDLTASYFGELAHAFVEAAGQAGITVLIDETGGQRDRERALLDVAGRSSWVDGVLLSALGLTPTDLAALRPAIPLVLLGERASGSTSRPVPFDHVGFDNVAAARKAVGHLLDCGRRHITAVGGTTRRSDVTSRLRLKGYRQELRAAGLAPQTRHARTADYTRAAGAAAVRELWSAAEEPPDALFCLNDDLATGALRELHRLGVAVPQDVSVVGFDDVEQSQFTTPALTSVALDNAALAGSALRLLAERVDGASGPAKDVRIGHRLVVRESSSC
jgi:LacI family repressor for deo operon, udp, cdd, tsx, nupC, and nupG